jgi:hypothetical protein
MCSNEASRLQVHFYVEETTTYNIGARGVW